MLAFATDFTARHNRPPYRDKEAVLAAQEAGYPINLSRAAYSALPDHLKAAPRKPQRTKQ